ncbi:unnamed protein product, partial [Scytosiphon promiscuus]
MQAHNPMMMAQQGGSWVYGQDPEGRPYWHNPATNQWTYGDTGQQQMMGYGYAGSTTPGPVYGWPGTTPATMASY